MNNVQCCMWWLTLLILVLPWCVATMLTWIYSEAFARVDSMKMNREDLLESIGSRIVSITQTCSALLYVLYISFAVVWIGFVGRKSLCSYCCLVVGIPTFAVIPVGACAILLIAAVGSSSGDQVSVDMGIAAAVSCLLSTMFCIMMTCCALMCGSRGRGKNHRYPIPLAYLPFLKDFKENPIEGEVSDVEKYTADYPPPLNSFSERKSSSVDSSVNPPKSSERRVSVVSKCNERRASVISNRLEVPAGHKLCDTPSTGSSKLSSVSSNGKPFASSNSRNTDRKLSVSSQISQPRAAEHRISVVSATSSSRTADRRTSVVSMSSLSKATDRKSSSGSSASQSKSRRFSVDSSSSNYKFSTQFSSSVGPINANKRNYSVGSSTSVSKVDDRKLSNDPN